MGDEQEQVKALWDDKAPTYRVMDYVDEEYLNMENAKVQQTVDGQWLYVDDVDGWSFIDHEALQFLSLELITD